MRKGEILSLRWQDMNLKQKILNIKGQNTKYSQSRFLPFNKEVFEIMIIWKAERFTKDDDYIFTNPINCEKLKDI